MGDFREHVLFGLLTAAIASVFFRGMLHLTPVEVFSSSTLLVAGSVLPDVDHENSYVYRAVKSFASLFAAVLAFYLVGAPVQFRFAAGSAALIAVYAAISSIELEHRGFTHTGRFAVLVSLPVAAFTVAFLDSFIPATAFLLGLLSHLILDGEYRF